MAAESHEHDKPNPETPQPEIPDQMPLLPVRDIVEQIERALWQ